MVARAEAGEQIMVRRGAKPVTYHAQAPVRALVTRFARWRRLGAAAPDPAERAALERAKARLDLLALYPRPVDISRVRIVHVPWLFRAPWFRRFDGYEMGPLILLRQPLSDTSDDLITHELCHVWQDQDHRLRMWASYLFGYADNPHEREARAAVWRTAYG